MVKPEIQQIKQRFEIIGTYPPLLRAIDVAVQVAPTDLSVLITGESGRLPCKVCCISPRPTTLSRTNISHALSPEANANCQAEHPYSAS